jgi:putative flippase GtrA
MKKLLKFSLIGLINTLITIISYIVLVKLGVNYILANCISYMIGLLNSYYWNKKWVFNYNEQHISVFVKFIIVNLFVLGINTLSIYLCVHNFGLNHYFAQLIATAIGMIFNFILNSKWTFGSKIKNRNNDL